jgi:hypothetical protein
MLFVIAPLLSLASLNLMSAALAFFTIIDTSAFVQSHCREIILLIYDDPHATVDGVLAFHVVVCKNQLWVRNGLVIISAVNTASELRDSFLNHGTRYGFYILAQYLNSITAYHPTEHSDTDSQLHCVGYWEMDILTGYFLQSLQANAGIYLKTSNDRFSCIPQHYSISQLRLFIQSRKVTNYQYVDVTRLKNAV